MNKLLLTSILILFLYSCYAPPPGVFPIIEEDTAVKKVKILAVGSESHKKNHRLNISFTQTMPPAISADGDYLLITFREQLVIPQQIGRTLAASPFPCSYQASGEKSTLRFRCSKDVVAVYPESTEVMVDIIARKQ
ncbi:MAG: hypothetical protein LBP51_01615 [Deferribacteraceae bacterium]|jgi:hypothetical protein|nr:hypothetical protein [Deferribacteraceae bacterium]